MKNAALKRARDLAGGVAALAKIVVRSRQAVHNWFANDVPVPAEVCPKIESATGVTCHELRPDIFPKPQDKEMTNGGSAHGG